MGCTLWKIFDYQTELSKLAIQRCLENQKCGKYLDECYMPENSMHRRPCSCRLFGSTRSPITLW